MPQIAQQDYKVIAPKEGRGFLKDAAALGELKKSVLNGTILDCLIKDTIDRDGDVNRVLGFYPIGTSVSIYSHANEVIENIELPYTVEQYEGLSSVQNNMDEVVGLMYKIPEFTVTNGHLEVDDPSVFICVDGKYLTVTVSAFDNIEALTIAENGPAEDFVNITWEDAQKLIGLPLKS